MRCVGRWERKKHTNKQPQHQEGQAAEGGKRREVEAQSRTETHKQKKGPSRDKERVGEGGGQGTAGVSADTAILDAHTHKKRCREIEREDTGLGKGRHADKGREEGQGRGEGGFHGRNPPFGCLNVTIGDPMK